MAKAKTADEVVQDLVQIVKQKREEIAKAERPNWITNGSFKYAKGSAESFNLQTISDVNVFINALAFLIDREKSYKLACEQLGVESDFDWFGFSVADWSSDFKTRITKIQITQKKKELEVFEADLDDLISPEKRRKMKIEKITKGLTQI